MRYVYCMKLCMYGLCAFHVKFMYILNILNMRMCLNALRMYMLCMCLCNCMRFCIRYVYDMHCLCVLCGSCIRYVYCMYFLCGLHVLFMYSLCVCYVLFKIVYVVFV